ncbi:DNA repair protein RecN [Pseudoflavonifractor phocaeensis]|uniref:DNA repair protein RecN n=1 Tax=Pseudoflavonifractor phocaeensis TaxID=1870988 RepID=UPI00313C9488
MLSVLHIENIAVIESADIVFGGGFNALTGETGAGKSIVVDAMGAVTGERASRDLIRTGAKSALVTGAFTQVKALPWFAENGTGPDENGELLLQREILPDGKNLCRVNGRPVTVAQLKALGRQLLNVHGQHDGQQLLDESCHLEYLDRFGDTAVPLADYRAAYGRLAELDERMRALQMDESEKARKVDTLQYQIGELERAELTAGEEEELQARRDLLRNAADLAEAAEAAHFALSGDEDSAGAAALLMEAEQALERMAGVSGELDALRTQLSECRCLAQDAAETARDIRGSFDFEFGELDELEGRLDLLYRLKKKYGATVEDMLDYLERCRKELDEIQFADDTLLRLEGERAKALEEARKRAETLSQARKAAGEALQTRIQSELAQLDMPRVRFQVAFAPVEGETGLNGEGMDTVRFLMSANVGEDLKPIQKIASGGELARIMLALKNVLAENDDVATLVFDEVDTGVSGRAAQKVAQKLAQVARHKQVLCVTHLPQIAAMADVHFSVEKGEKAGRTYTAVEALDRGRRQAELARLTSGDQVTQASLDSAGELLDGAEEYKKSL